MLMAALEQLRGNLRKSRGGIEDDIGSVHLILRDGIVRERVPFLDENLWE